MINISSYAIRARIVNIGANINAAARNAELSAITTIRAKLTQYPSIRPFLGQVGYRIGVLASKDEGLFRNYCTISDWLVPAGKTILPDYRAYRSRIELIRQNTVIVASLSDSQVSGILGALSPRDNVLAAMIKHNYIVERILSNAENTGEIDPEGSNGYHNQFERDVQAIAARVKNEITPEKPVVVEGSVVAPEIDTSKAITISSKGYSIT